MRRLVGWWLRRRRVVLVVPVPGATFHLEMLPGGIVRPVLDDPTVLDPYVEPGRGDA